MVVAFLACSGAAFGQTEVAPGVLLVGTIQNAEIGESSGIAVSKKGKGAFWTHNDGGLDKIYAINSAGASLGEWKLKDVELDNIEDIAATASRVYVADIGNDTGARDVVQVVAVPAPNPARSGDLRPARIWQLAYPNGPFDAESFFVWKTGGYVIPRGLGDGGATVYKFPLNKRGASFVLQPTCKLHVGDEPRGADLSADGKRLAVITSSGAYLFTFAKAGIPADGTLEPALFVPFSDASMEGCCFTPDGLLVTSEGRNLYLFTDVQFQYPPRRRR